jgi:hypothetical protein
MRIPSMPQSDLIKASSTGFFRTPFALLMYIEKTLADMIYDTTEKEENTINPATRMVMLNPSLCHPE